MRLVTSSKGKLPAIVQALIETKGNFIVVTEFQTKSEAFIQDQLKEAGYFYQLTSSPSEKTNGIFIASHFPLTLLPQQYHPNNPYRWLEVGLPEQNLTVLALHIPE